MLIKVKTRGGADEGCDGREGGRRRRAGGFRRRTHPAEGPTPSFRRGARARGTRCSASARGRPGAPSPSLGTPSRRSEAAKKNFDDGDASLSLSLCLSLLSLSPRRDSRVLRALCAASDESPRADDRSRARERALDSARWSSRSSTRWRPTAAQSESPRPPRRGSPFLEASAARTSTGAPPIPPRAPRPPRRRTRRSGRGRLEANATRRSPS